MWNWAAEKNYWHNNSQGPRNAWEASVFFVKFNFGEFQVLGKGGNLSFFFLVQEPALEMVCASVGYTPVSFLPIKPLQNLPSAQ